MKVLCLAKDLNPRQGWGRYAVELIRGLREDWNVDITTCTPPGPYQGDVATLGTTRWNVRDYFRAKTDAKQLALAGLGANLIHSLDETTAQVGARLAENLGLPFVLTLHGTYSVEPLRGYKGWPLRRAFQSADIVVANSEYTLTQSEEAIGSPYNFAEVISLGVNSANIDDNPRLLASRSRNVLSVGSIKARKGILANILAFAEISAKVPDAKLIIAGSYNEQDPYFVKLRNEVLARGLEDRVVLLGEITEDDLTDLYRTSRVFCMPALREGDHFEGFGLVHLEASARGLPTIGSIEGGNGAAIQDGSTGLIIDPRNHSQIARAMLSLLTDDELWTRMSQAGVKWAAKMSWKSTATETYMAYVKAFC